MLQLKNITKTYITGTLKQDALKDVSISFRKNEFVAILGHSGSGKTTMLNIIGGLDQYTSGDLIINGVSTKKYKDKDWDAYRNHSIGFVFQSYNLIPHQTILANVELALTISGVSAKERKERAKKALIEVGLEEHINKKPTQMSGGQMQRVAIARALINNPDILLADEPTGALDSDTSVQVMNILKEVAKDRLVIMVTHNPDLAYEYANRIVKLSDGCITDDSNPYVSETSLIEKPTRIKNKSMSFFTAFSLSMNNLLTKKVRTLLTSFAGSIGIMGIALILSVSTGVQNYIDDVQEEALSSYPLTINSESSDMTSLLTATSGAVGTVINSDKELTEFQMVTSMFAEIGTNDIKSFNEYLEKNGQDILKGINTRTYAYGITPQIYTSNFDFGITQVNPSNILSDYFTLSTSIMSFSGQGVFSEMMDDQELLETQYNVVAGRWPEKYDEIIMVLTQENAISDYMTYSLGFRDPKELKEMISDMLGGKTVENVNEALSWNYNDLLNTTYKLVNSSDYYKYNSKYDVYEDMRNDEEYLKNLINNGLTLKIVGIVSPKEKSGGAALTPGMAYTRGLTEYLIDYAKKSNIVKKQLANEEIDVFSGKTFKQLEDEEEDDKLAFEDMISIDEDKIKDAFIVNISEDDFKFETMSEEDIMSLTMSASTDIYSNITNPNNLNIAKNQIKMIISGIVQGVLSTYENIPNMVFTIPAIPDVSEESKVLVIDNTVLSIFAANVNANSVKSGINNMNKELSAMFDDEDYENIATLAQQAIANAGVILETYSIEYEITDSPSVKVVKYVNEEGESTYSKLGGTNEITSSQLLTQVTDPLDVNALAVKFNTKKSIFTTALSIGNVVGEVTGPIVESLSGLGEKMSGDLMSVDTDKFAEAFQFDMDEEEITRLIEAYMSPDADKSYNTNLSSLDYADLEKPTMMSVYLKDFEAKENFMNFIDDYNDKMKEMDEEDKVITYTDITGMLMSSVKTIVDAISYVLIAFVAISLIVSSIMIGVITLISVMERTKEIGILRAIGASKRDISHVFNVETFIIGLLSGLIGVGVSLFLLIPINKILYKVTEIENLKAVLPSYAIWVLIVISVVLTLFAGIIPSSSAAKKDPVESLRTE